MKKTKKRNVKKIRMLANIALGGSLIMSPAIFSTSLNSTTKEKNQTLKSERKDYQNFDPSKVYKIEIRKVTHTSSNHAFTGTTNKFEVLAYVHDDNDSSMYFVFDDSMELNSYAYLKKYFIVDAPVARYGAKILKYSKYKPLTVTLDWCHKEDPKADEMGIAYYIALEQNPTIKCSAWFPVEENKLSAYIVGPRAIDFNFNWELNDPRRTFHYDVAMNYIDGFGDQQTRRVDRNDKMFANIHWSIPDKNDEVYYIAFHDSSVGDMHVHSIYGLIEGRWAGIHCDFEFSCENGVNIHFSKHWDFWFRNAHYL